MNTPIILLCGQSGSGKDTVGAYIAEKYNGVTIGQADPMKRLVGSLMGFSESQLWGSSEERAAKVKLSLRPESNFDYRAVNDVIPPGTDLEFARRTFLDWYQFCIKKSDAEDGVSARYVLQTLGTEWGRSVSQDMWSLYAIKTAKLLLAGNRRYSRMEGSTPDSSKSYDFVVITDGRFRNELLNVRAEGGLVVKIVRPGADGTTANGAAGHQSEAELGGIPDHFFDCGIYNNGYKERLFEKIDEMMAPTGHRLRYY